MAVEQNQILTHRRTKGNIRTKLGMQIMDGETAVDLTGLTLKFTMVDDAGNVKVALSATGITVPVGTSGYVEKTFLAADVDTAGTFWAWFVIEEAGGEQDHVPMDGRRYRVEIYEAA